MDSRLSEPTMHFYCACAAYEHDPGMVVCWKCEQPLAEFRENDLNAALLRNVLELGHRYRLALETIIGDSKRSELADAEYLRGIAIGALDVD